MSSLSDQLYSIYTATIYPVLVQSDPRYRQSLAKAGLGWTPAATVPPVHRSSFEQEMKLQAWLAASQIVNARSLEPTTIRAKVLNGPLTLYRVSQGGAAEASGIWWFTEKIAQQCRHEAGSDLQSRLDWLRNLLAVCYNWSRFDRIQRLNVYSGEKLPAVMGRGLPMPYYKVDPHIDRKTGERSISLPHDYWKKKGETLMGGELQIVLPWVPVRRVIEINSL